MHLYLIRHGETRLNTERRLHSLDDQETLNEVGRIQMQRVADALLPANIQRVITSGTGRTIESGQILVQVLGVPMRTVAGLHERNWGEWSGRTWSEVAEELDPMSLDERYTFVPPGGESWKVFEQRLHEAVDTIVAEAADEAGIAIVTHGGVIRALMPYFLNEGKESSFQYDFANASITEVTYTDKQFGVKRINDTAHLLI